MRSIPCLASGCHGEQGKRPSMEDAHAVHDDLWTAGYPDRLVASAVERPLCAFYGIYDGHGGKRAAAFAASHLHLNVRQRLEQLSAEELENGAAVQRCLREAFLETEAGWATKAKLRQMYDGSTAVTALVVGNRLFVANLGDSRLIICGEGGTVRFATRDHKPDLPSEEKRIRAAGGYVKKVFGIARVNGDLALSRAFGDMEYKEVQPGSKGPIVSPDPDITEYHLGREDRFMVLACDGLWDVYSNAKVGELVWAWLAKGTGMGDVASFLVKRALLEKDQHDNVSAITVSFWQAPLAAPGKGKRRPGRGSPCPSPALLPADTHRADGTHPWPMMEPLLEAAAAQDGPSSQAHCHRCPGRVAGHAAEPDGPIVAEEAELPADAAVDSTGGLSPRPVVEEEPSIPLPARRPGSHRRRRAKAQLHTCAPPPGSHVVNGITRVPAAGPADGSEGAGIPRQYGCPPPPGAQVIAGITVVVVG